MAIIVSLAARGLAARRREMVTVMADLGATRRQTAGRIADEAAVIGLYAGLVGGALAGVAGARRAHAGNSRHRAWKLCRQ